MRKNRKIIIIFTDDSKLEEAQAIRDFFATDKDKLPIIIGEEEFQSIAGRLIKDRFLNEESMLMRLWNKGKMQIESRKIDKLPSQDLTFKSNIASYRKAYNILVRYNPELVILNGSTVMQEVLSARNKVNPDIKVVMVLSSYILDKQTINKSIDRYFVDNMTIKTTLVNEGIWEDKISLADFPIPKEFDLPVDTEEIFKEYGFTDNKPTIMVGVPITDNYLMREAICELSNWVEEFNIIVDCGRDRDILVYARDRGIKAINEGRDSHPLYSVADIVISRPSPLIIAKTLYKNKLFLCLEGRNEKEKRTAQYLNGAIINVKKENPISNILKQYIENPDSFNSVKEEIAKHNEKRQRGFLWQALELLL